MQFAVDYYVAATDTWVLDAPRFNTRTEAEGYAANIEIRGYGEQVEVVEVW